MMMENRWKIELIDILAHLVELEVQKHLLSFPYRHFTAGAQVEAIGIQSNW